MNINFFLNRISKIILFILIILIFYTAIFFDDFYNSTVDTLNVWLYKVVPPIFNFYILINLLLKFRILNKIFIIFNPLNRLFKFDSISSLYLYLTGILIGNPSFSAILNNYKENNIISNNDFERLLKCCSFQTPLYIMSLFSNIKVGLVLILSNILSSIVICIVSIKKKDNTIARNVCIDNNISFNEIFYKGTSIIINIGAVMVFFNSIIIALDFINVPKLLTIFLEISNGIFFILNSSYTVLIKICIISFLLSFNCFSIHMQIYCNIKDFKYLSFFIYRVINGLLSIVFSITLYILLLH